MSKRNHNAFSCMDDVPGIPTKHKEVHLAGSMNRVKDIPVNPIVVHAEYPASDIPTDFESECLEDTVQTDFGIDNTDCADDVPAIPTPLDDVNSTLPK